MEEIISIPGKGICCFCCEPADKICPYCKLIYFCCDQHHSIHRPEDFCFPFRVETDAVVGRYVVATRDIKATGSLIKLKTLNCIKIARIFNSTLLNCKDYDNVFSITIKSFELRLDELIWIKTSEKVISIGSGQLVVLPKFQHLYSRSNKAGQLNWSR